MTGLRAILLGWFVKDTFISESLILVLKLPIGHLNNIPTMQQFRGISRNTPSKSYILSLTECLRDYQNNALWETQ